MLFYNMNAKKDLPKETQDALKGKSINIIYTDEKDKYSKKRFVYVSRGYDFLGRLYVVRTYIQKRYNLDRHALELLLMLMELKVFNRKMFADLPRPFKFARFNTFIEEGYVNLVMDDEKTENRIYTLSTKYRNIVMKFYHYLSGEEKIPEDSVHNPLANKNTQIPFDRKKLEMIKRLNKLEVPKHKRFLFE